MEAARLPYTCPNILYTAILLLVTAGYVVQLRAFNAEADAQNVRGYEGEASFWVVLPLLLLCCSCSFGLATGGMALVRGSRPMSGWVLFLGLLPTVPLLGISG